MKGKQLIDPMVFRDQDKFVFVDDWVPRPEDMLFKTVKGYIITDVSDYYGAKPNMELDAFVMPSKRSYNSPTMREHIVRYVNYFEKYYDTDRLLYSAYCKIKYMIDCEPGYTKEMLFYDIMRYIVRGPIEFLTWVMVQENYRLNLNYKSRTSPSLQYTNNHAMLLMKISVQMNQIIPLLCHFMYRRKVQNTNEFLFEIYDKLIEHPYIDIYGKLYETAYSNIMSSVKGHSVIWGKQDIRGIDPVIHAIQCVQNILINIICKYNFSENIVHYNYSSILKNTGFQITGIEYEYTFVSLSSSKRDEDKVLVPLTGNSEIVIHLNCWEAIKPSDYNVAIDCKRESDESLKEQDGCSMGKPYGMLQLVISS